MLIHFKRLHRGLLGLLFPEVCEICGLRLSKTEHFVCQNCLSNRFEIANPFRKQISAEVFLPEGVSAQHALWKFDKGGHLQDLLHKLKYNRLYGVGEDLGMALGQSISVNPFFSDTDDMILVPVPLHPKKKRMRGYNQARYIAKGIKNSTGLPMCDSEDVVRVKNTKTQTGFTLEKRRENIAKAFRVDNKKAFEGKVCVIVDDVFTTGATTFELASVLLKAGALKIMITTVAQA